MFHLHQRGPVTLTMVVCGEMGIRRETNMAQGRGWTAETKMDQLALVVARTNILCGTALATLVMVHGRQMVRNADNLI